MNEEPEQRFETLAPLHRLGAILEALRTAHPYEEVSYDLVPLDNPVTDTGLGRRGCLPKAMRLDAFARQVAALLDAPETRFSGDPERKVRTVGVLGGSGGSELAVLSGVDVIVTGDVRYHEAQDAAERGLAVVDAGHAATEQGVVGEIAIRLKKAFPGVRVGVHKELAVLRSAFQVVRE